jgi:hypothetical protein
LAATGNMDGVTLSVREGYDDVGVSDTELYTEEL